MEYVAAVIPEQLHPVTINYRLVSTLIEVRGREPWYSICNSCGIDSQNILRVESSTFALVAFFLFFS